jgi:hypothetical protein
MGCANESYYYNGSEKVAIYPQINRTDTNVIYYENENGTLLGVSDKIILKVKDGVEIDSILQKYNLILEKSVTKRVYVVKVADKSMCIGIANNLKEDKDIVYAQPDFIKQNIKR